MKELYFQTILQLTRAIEEDTRRIAALLAGFGPIFCR